MEQTYRPFNRYVYADKIIAALEDSDAKHRLLELYSSYRGDLNDAERDMHELNSRSGPLAIELHSRLFHYRPYFSKIRLPKEVDVFLKKIANTVDSPNIVTVDDLECSFANAAAIKALDFDSFYVVFLNEIISQHLTLRSSNRFFQQTVPPDISEYDHENNEFPEKKHCLWSKNGVELNEITGDADDIDQGTFSRYLKIYGVLSESSLYDVQEKLRKVLPSLTTSILLTKPMSYDTAGIESLQAVRSSHENILSQMLDFYLSAVEADQIARRIQNAITLLIEADNQDNDNIKLALCFSAIEALVCYRRRDISINEQLKTNVTVLLEPDPNNRRDHEKRIKKLYGIRSETLHGANVTDSVAHVATVRKMAAGCLVSVVLWRNCQKRVDPQEGNRLKSLMNELREAFASGRTLVGVPEYSSQWLPAEE